MLATEISSYVCSYPTTPTIYSQSEPFISLAYDDVVQIKYYLYVHLRTFHWLEASAHLFAADFGNELAGFADCYWSNGRCWVKGCCCCWIRVSLFYVSNCNFGYYCSACRYRKQLDSLINMQFVTNWKMNRFHFLSDYLSVILVYLIASFNKNLFPF